MSFVDRLSGKSENELPKQLHFSRWLFRSSDEDESGVGSEYEAIVPGFIADQVLAPPSVDIPYQTRFFAGAFSKKGSSIIGALLQIGQLLQRKRGWQDWIDTIPLVPELDKKVKLHKFARCIDREFKHLAAVCRSPRTHIQVETERDLASRVRRISPKASVWLASHTEDWEHRNLSGVQPRQVLAEIRKEKWDIYENRVTVQLVDNLIVWLQDQIAAVRHYKKTIQTIEKYGNPEETNFLNHWRAKRIYSLRGEAWDPKHSLQEANNTSVQLKERLRRVSGLKNSYLCRKILNAHVPYGLQMTNLLRSDEHYRGVARLWQERTRLATPPVLRSDELYMRNQDLYHSFNAWCMLVVVRACSQLKLNPEETARREFNIQPGCDILLNGKYRLAWEQDGTITIAFANQSDILMRLVPLAHALEATQEPGKCLTPLIKSVDGEPHWTVILHLASPSNHQNEIPASIGNPPAFDKSGRIIAGAIDFIRVSPFLPESVELVARAIRWATLAPQMLEYPFPISNSQELLQGQLSCIEDGRVVRPPCSDEVGKVSRCLREARSRLDLRRQKLQSMRSKSSKGQRSNLRNQIRKDEKDVEQLQNFKSEFNIAQKNIEHLALCPVCGEEGATFKSWDQDCFRASCRKCGARWELQYDPKAMERIPGFLPLPIADWSTESSTWVDDIFGCDILAIPMRGGKFRGPRKIPFESGP